MLYYMDSSGITVALWNLNTRAGLDQYLHGNSRTISRQQYGWRESMRLDIELYCDGDTDVDADAADGDDDDDGNDDTSKAYCKPHNNDMLIMTIVRPVIIIKKMLLLA